MRGLAAVVRSSRSPWRSASRVRHLTRSYQLPVRSVLPIRSLWSSAGRGLAVTLHETRSSNAKEKGRTIIKAREHLQRNGKQDPYGRITYVPPVWFFARISTVDIVNEILRHFPDAASIEAHVLPFWAVSSTSYLEITTHPGNSHEYKYDNTERVVRVFSCSVAAVPLDHWASGVVLESGSVPPVDFAYDGPVTSAAVYGEYLSVEPAEQEFLPSEHFDSFRVPPFHFARPGELSQSKADASIFAQLLGGEIAWELQGGHVRSHLVDWPTHHFASPTYRPCYRVKLRSGLDGYLDAGHIDLEIPQAFRLLDRGHLADRKLSLSRRRRSDVRPFIHWIKNPEKSGHTWRTPLKGNLIPPQVPPPPPLPEYSAERQDMVQAPDFVTYGAVSGSGIKSIPVAATHSPDLCDWLCLSMQQRSMMVGEQMWEDPAVIPFSGVDGYGDRPDSAQLWAWSRRLMENPMLRRTLKPPAFPVKNPFLIPTLKAPVSQPFPTIRDRTDEAATQTVVSRSGRPANGASSVLIPTPGDPLLSLTPESTKSKTIKIPSYSSSPPRPAALTPARSEPWNVPLPRRAKPVTSPLRAPQTVTPNGSPSVSDASPIPAFPTPKDNLQYYSALHVGISPELLNPARERTINRDLEESRRRLLWRHHTDRGGTLDRAQAINEAMAHVETYALRVKYQRECRVEILCRDGDVALLR